MVNPVLNYGSETFGYYERKNIEQIRSKFICNVSYVKKSTHVEAYTGELGRHAMSVRRKITIMKYLVRILNTINNALIKLIYEVLRNDADNNINYNGMNWAPHVKQILSDIGLLDIWISQDVLSVNINLITQRIFDVHQQT